MRYLLCIAAVSTLVAVAGCTTASNPANNPPPPVNTTFTVPAADIEPVPASGTPWDVLSVTTSRTGPAGSATYTNIAITINFAQANAFAALPAPGSIINGTGTQLGIVVGFDADQNSATGTSASCNGFTYGTGFDHAIDGGAVLTPRLADGNFQIFTEPAMAIAGEATVSGSGSQVIINVPISALGGTGQTNMFVAIVNTPALSGITDCVPDMSVIQT